MALRDLKKIFTETKTGLSNELKDEILKSAESGEIMYGTFMDRMRKKGIAPDFVAYLRKIFEA
ncbi:hypothetical protein KJ885_00960 [Patescibacteria group bacterium]|nr:hypothetical protein [Patescibacteria group bacterium]